MIVNVNIRQTSDNELYVQYQEKGKARDKAFLNWESLIEWLKEKTNENLPS